MIIPTLKQFSKHELIHLLMECAKHLEQAYQETLDRELWRVAVQASFASEFLQFEVCGQEKNYTTH
ncbi:hypothetical protein [Legionella drancourtii]|uniref:Uncharacterized protein n=1 Tax=Legionella drancourtii LLAP12 TaxID=658187 RepID=G9ESN4_9GAMM|nr:hypothetical protein [Legionella drancourtii]EHL29715.1 hypothetical protein LDG_8305 [Legionella drancourtii LLAP12]